MFWEQKIQYAALSDVGFRRQNNQDSCVSVLATDRESWEERGHLFVVADGMGGHAVGELASKMAVDTVPHTFDKLRTQHPLSALKTSLETANERIHERGSLNRDFLRMGTTCSTLLLCPLGAIIGHVGDSRVYRVRGHQIDQLTRDHSLIWELIEQRKVHPRDADRLYPRNVITRSLGPEATVKVDIEGPSVVHPGDTYVLCSDGLTTHVSDPEVGMIAGELPPSEACRMLVNLANLRGGSDNITVVIVRAGEIPKQVLPPTIPRFDPTAESGGWGVFVLFCSLSLTAIVGFLLVTLTENKLVGSILLVAAMLGIAGVWWFRRQALPEAPPLPDDGSTNSTIIWRPYRTASAKLTTDFLLGLAKVESELYQAAVEEHWPVELDVREDAFRKAQEALSSRKYGAALREYARSLDALMIGLSWQRKQMQKDAKGAKPADPRQKSGLTPPPPTRPPEGAASGGPAN